MEKRVIGAKETVKLDVQGNLVTYVVYTYMIGDYGPFTYEVPKAQDSAEGLIAAMNAKEEILTKVTGSEE